MIFYRYSMQSHLDEILRRAISAANNRSPNVCYSAVECHPLVQRTFDWGGGNRFAWRGGVGTGAQLPSSLLKNPCFQDRHWGTSAHWI